MHECDNNGVLMQVWKCFAGATTIQSLTVLKRSGHLSMVSFDKPAYLKLIGW